MTTAEYVKMFPDAKLTSDDIRKKMKEIMTGREITWKDKISSAVSAAWDEGRTSGRTNVPLSEESRTKLSEKMMGHSVSEETRKAIGLAGLGREPWNKNLTKEDDPRLLVVSEKISAYNANMPEETKEETKRKISATLKDKYSKGMPIPNAKNGYRNDLGMSFRSTWEANYARILKLQGKPIVYEKSRLPVPKTGAPNFVYIPDFEVDGEYVEIKGHAKARQNWGCNCSRCQRDKTKMDAVEKEYGITIVLVATAEYKEMKSKYSSLIPEWE